MNDSTAHEDTLPLHIEQLWIYPVKSCAGLRLSSVELQDTGLEWDRAWMVVDETGEFVSQRELPRMALIQPRLHPGWLELGAPGMLSLQVPLDATGVVRSVKVWDDEVEAWDMGDAAARWFERFLTVPGSAKRFRLVRFDPTVRRLSSLQWTGGVQAPNLFSDGYPVLVLSSAALQDLNERLAVLGHAPVGAERFRPNIVLGGLEAHDEDRLAWLRLSAQVSGVVGAEVPPQVLLQPVKPCSRCSIPDVDPQTAQRGSAVSQVLQAYRQDKRLMGAVTFGMNVIVRAGAGQMLHEGMEGVGVWGAWQD